MPRSLASMTPLIALAMVGAAVGLITPEAKAQSWQAGTANSNVNGTVFGLTMWDPDGAGPQPPVLAATGTFTTAGLIPANRIATWNGSDWSTFPGTGLDSNGSALATLSSDNSLVAAGAFANANGVSTRRIARWDGTAWSGLNTGTGNTPVFFLTSIATLNADTIVACGVFTAVGGPDGATSKNIATWNSTTGWASLGDGVSSNPFVCAALSNGNILVSHGGETSGSGATTMHRVGRWDGAWHQMGEGFTTPLDGVSPIGLARCFLEMPNGDVIAGGSLLASGSTGLYKIGRWDHVTDTWMPLGSGINNDSSLTTNNRDVYALALMPNGDVIAGGDFNTAGGTTQNYIARWRPSTSTWSAMAPGDVGLGGPVRSLCVLPNGDLAVGGDFLTAGGVAAQRFAIWHEPAQNPPTPPSITVQPVSVAICIEPTASGTFTLAATGSEPLTYQWQQQDLGDTFPDFIDINDGPVPDIFGHPIFTATGATTNHLTLSDPQGYAQVFRCRVSNGLGHVDSTEVTLSYCHADFDCSGALAVQDIFNFLSAWFAGEARADFNFTDGLGVQDIFDFLSAWFEGC